MAENISITQQNLAMQELLRNIQSQGGYPVPPYAPRIMHPYKRITIMARTRFKAKQ